MNRRIIITGKNNELPREVFSRPMSSPLQGSSHTRNCDMGFSSGTRPDAVAVRSDRRACNPSAAAPHARSAAVEDVRDPYFWLDMTAILLIGCGTVGLLTAVLI